MRNEVTKEGVGGIKGAEEREWIEMRRERGRDRMRMKGGWKES